TPPAPGALPPGCAFAPRCPLAADICRTADPEPQRVEGRLVACHRWPELPHPAARLFQSRSRGKEPEHGPGQEEERQPV
ncbi:methionine ABC transporter ATP-binding protein, partial [Streptomyces sp. Lzd4kr]|nr:methionine ABC transporter ATP-binding protein [Streptomyces sp. Lzd4kr]